MNDTSEKVERRYRAMLMALSPERRLRMASEMFATARVLAREGLRAEFGELSEPDLRVRMFLRLYGEEFSPERRERILQRIAAAASRPPRAGEG